MLNEKKTQKARIHMNSVAIRYHRKNTELFDIRAALLSLTTLEQLHDAWTCPLLA